MLERSRILSGSSGENVSKEVPDSGGPGLIFDFNATGGVSLAPEVPDPMPSPASPSTPNAGWNHGGGS